MLTREENRLRVYLKVLLAIYAVIFVLLIIDIFRTTTTFSVPFLISFSLIAFLNFLMCRYSVSDLRRFSLLVNLQVWESVMAAVAGVCILIWKDTSVPVPIWDFSFTLKSLLIASIIFNVIHAFLLTIFLSSAERARYGLKYFSPIQFKTLSALAEVVIYGENEIISHDEVAKNVDTYFNTFEAKSKWTMAMVITCLYFYPLLSFYPPLPYISAETRLKFLKKRFYRDIEARLMPEFWRVFAQGMIRIAKQMCYIGYYNDKRTFSSVGYIPFSERKDAKERLAGSPVKVSPELFVRTEKDIKEDTVEGDVVIIGTGAAASVLAKGLIENGRKVIMVERGYYERPETFTENEMEMVSRLYHDGAIQAARDFRFTVFQGSCVGGSTVLNNAVCFKMPEDVLDKWNSNGLKGELNKTKVMKSMDRVWNLMGTNNMAEDKIRLNPGGYLFRDGCKKLGYSTAPNVTNSVNANISGCVGCGYCNIGCTFNKKLSMLTTVLPDTQKKYGKESLQIIAGCEAIRLHKSGNKISYLEGEFTSKRKIKIRGKTFIVSAGAISSSIILLKSKLGVDNVGLNLSFNMGSQLTAAFPHKIDSYDGLQISHFMKNSPDKGFIMESWFNPPMFQSTAMPGWFEDHYNNMQRYDKLACVGILVGSEANARVRIAGLTGREIDYTPTRKDFQKLLSGLELAGEIMFAGGAESVMPNSFKYYEFRNNEEVKKLHELIKDPSEITLGTGHPQGGNALASTPDKGVVNPEFRVFGYDNLFVCDASVFPTSVGINPQITVMGLADYAVEFIKDN